jgi:hypothetical protein
MAHPKFSAEPSSFGRHFELVTSISARAFESGMFGWLAGYVPAWWAKAGIAFSGGTGRPGFAL